MPKVHHRKARKDYPNDGIRKGDMYYIARIKTGPRSSRTIRSLTPIPQSKLTSSPFKSGWYAMLEGWPDVITTDAIREVASVIAELGEEAEASYENMPESLQEGETGQLLYARYEHCQTTADELETIADDLDNLDEPQEPDFDPADYTDETAEMSGDEAAEFLTEKEQELWDNYDVELSGYEAEVEMHRDNATDLINDMPE